MEPQNHHQLRFITWNTMGIKSTKSKRSKLPFVLDELITQKADVVFLQETHIGPKCYDVLETVIGWKSFFTVHHPRSKGVAILIKDHVSFQYICHDEDYSGGYIVLFCHLYGKLHTLVNVYNHKADRDMLYRLRDYLTAINTKGVLVIGGDFNTVLDPTFDRKPLGDTYHSSLRRILEEFINALDLTDMFVYSHPMSEGFTRSQNKSHSRLDMFFMPTNTKNYVIACKNVKGKMRESKSGEKRISDHDPLVLDIQVPPICEYNMPEVASMLDEFGYNDTKPDRRAGKINGSEILSAIRSLPDSTEQTPDNLNVNYYKKFALPMTEILKKTYNVMLENKSVPKSFVKSLSNASANMHYFNVDYLIFAHILAKRLKVFIKPSFSRRKVQTYDVHICVTFKEATISLFFLKERLSSLKPINPTPPKDFSILESLLPEVRKSSNDNRLLRQGCPLTKPILTLALKYLEDQLNSSGYASICHHRQSLLILTIKENKTLVCDLIDKFSESSGIDLSTTNCC